MKKALAATDRIATIDVDVKLDLRRDTPEGKDPDLYSKTLRHYHKRLWSKPLPSGAMFELKDDIRGHYLYHQSALGEFTLSSDTVIPTFRWHKGIQQLIPHAQLMAFNADRYTIGGMMLFPGNRIDGKWTINQARGCTRLIGDRFDLTLECIRRHYSGGDSPLCEVLRRYAEYFDLFGDFRGYVEFFFLHDLVSSDFSQVNIFSPFDDFRRSPIPSTADEYASYETSARSFITARNARISGWRARA